uniref:Uncharacterized protein n=1 Tax=Strigamia maritima TaxID=126957 RepID=T1JN47_STRMM
MNVQQVRCSFWPKPVSTYQFDFRGVSYAFHINNQIKPERTTTKFSFPGVSVGYKDIMDMTYTTSSQTFYPPIRNFYRRKPTDQAPTARNLLTTSHISHRETIDLPQILHWKYLNEAVTEPKIEPVKTKPDINERGTPLQWSRLPKEGCRAPEPISPCKIAVRPPSKCDCPSSCCTRIACRTDTPVCICGVPCTEPTGNPVICNACLCYVFPGNPKAFSTRHFCPRTQSEALECPECKSVLPKDPMEEKEENYFPANFNVPKTSVPIFQKVIKS